MAGGGPGGVSAAIAAAKSGARTILLEREGCLGGGMTTLLVGPFMPHLTHLDADGKPPRKVVNAGIFRELCERLSSRGQAWLSGGQDTVFDDETAKLVLDEMAAEADAAEKFLTETLKPINVEKASSAELAPAEYEKFRATLAGHIAAMRNAMGL